MNIFVKLFNNINRGDILTNINCSSNCIYQKEGKCCYSKVFSSYISANSDCAYFSPNNKKKKVQ